MPKTIILPLFFALLFMAGCQRCEQQHPTGKTIRQAQDLTYTDPDSAYVLLKDLQDHIDEMPEKDRMNYYLTLAEVKNQQGIPLTTDSIQLMVADYFQRHGSAVDRMRSQYQLGYAYAQMGEAPKALKYYHQAVEEPVDTTAKDNCRLLHRIHSQIASLLCDQNMPLEQLKEERLAKHYAMMAGDTLLALRHDTFAAWAYELLGKTDSTISILERTHQTFLDHGDTTSAAQLRGLEMHLFIDSGDFAKTRECIDEYECHSGYFDGTQKELPDFGIYYYNKGRYFLGTGDTKQAEEQFRKSLLSSVDKEAGYRGLSLLYKQLGRTDSLAKYAELCYIQSDSNILRSSARELQRMLSVYNYSRSERKAHLSEIELEKSRAKTIFWILSAAFILAVSLLTFYYYRKRRDEHQQTMEEGYKREIRHLNDMQADLVRLQQNELDVMKKEKEEAIEQLKKLLAEKYPIQVLDEQRKALHESAIYKQLKENVSNRQHIDRCLEWNEVYRLIGTVIPGFFDKLEAHGYILTEDERRLCALVRLEMPTYATITLLDISPSNYSNKRKRLLMKIFNIDGSGKDFDRKIMEIF